MKILDDVKKINQLDRGKVVESMNGLSEQCQQAFTQASTIETPSHYQQIKNMVICAMGGSAYGARIVKSLYQDAKMTKIPIELVNNYHLPGYVDHNSLVILASYSGETEEVIAAAQEAKKRMAKIIGITSGGKLASFLTNNSYPRLIFNPIYNPSKQPRMGVGYMVIGLIGFLAKMKTIPVVAAEINSLVRFIVKQNQRYTIETVIKDNPAKKLALALWQKLPVLISSSYFEGTVHAVSNMFHETSKQFAVHFPVPEANHHLLESFAHPKTNRENLLIVFISSGIDDKRDKKRLKLTKEVVEKNNIKAIKVNLPGPSGLIQSMALLQLSSWLTFYLSVLNGVDPTKIPWVDFFKKKLKGAK